MPILADPNKEEKESRDIYNLFERRMFHSGNGFHRVIKQLILAIEKETFGVNMTLFYKVTNTENIFIRQKINVLGFVSNVNNNLH